MAKSSDGFLSLVTWVSVLGVALGVLALTVVTSVINGFEDELARSVTGVNGDVVVYSRATPIRYRDRVEAQIRDQVPDLVGLAACFTTELMIAGPDGVAGGVIEGIELDSFLEVVDLESRLIEGRLPSGNREIVLGEDLAHRLDVRVGIPVRLIAPLAESGNSPRASEFEVVGIARMGMHQYDSKYGFANLTDIQDFLQQPERVTTFKLRLQDVDQATAVANRLEQQFSYPLRAKAWSHLHRNLFYAIRLEKVVIGVLLTAIIIVAAFNVICTLMMMIYDKTKEISILKAMGMRPFQSFSLFALIGLGIGACGTFAGLAAGLAVNWGLSKTSWVDLPADVYSIDFLPVVFNWGDIGIIAALAVGICLLATLYPALEVSRRSALEGIRSE